MKQRDTKNHLSDKLHIGDVIERSSFWFNQLSEFEKWLKYCKMVGINTREQYRETFTEQEIIDIYEYHEAINAL